MSALDQIGPAKRGSGGKSTRKLGRNFRVRGATYSTGLPHPHGKLTHYMADGGVTRGARRKAINHGCKQPVAHLGVHGTREHTTTAKTGKRGRKIKAI